MTFTLIINSQSFEYYGIKPVNFLRFETDFLDFHP